MKAIYAKTKKSRWKQHAMRFLFAALFLFGAASVQAQNVYMHSGTQTVPSTGSLKFYDSGGPSSADYWWEKWYSHNENSTLVFKNGTSPVQIVFNQFTAYDGNTGANIGSYSLRVNNDHLYIYEGEVANDDNLIVDLTGNIEDAFTVMTNGPMTIKFVSDDSYREEGWAASVSSPTAFAVPAPIIVKETCSDVVNIYNPALGATIYYTLDGNDPEVPSKDPLSAGTLYNGPFAIDLDATDASVTVKAIAVVEGFNNNDNVASVTFTHEDQRPTPGEPTITISGNTVTMTPGPKPVGINDTYYVRYTTNGDAPTANNGTVYTEPFEWTTPNTTFLAITQATECPDKISSVVSKTFGNVTVPTPEIVFGTVKDTIKVSLANTIITYTTNGSDPTPGTGASNVTAYTYTPEPTEEEPNPQPVILYYYIVIDHVAAGTTVKAMANRTDTGYVESAIASAIYVPGGGSTVEGGIVLLDDREDHSWSYYSDGNQPIHSLKPIDVKITYKGYGPKTMTGDNTQNMPTPVSGTNSAFDTDVDADQVAVNVGEAGNQFIYLKTLENDNPEGGENANTYSYTMIANPFQVRPAAAAGTVSPTVTRYVRVTAITEGKKYLIVSQSNAGTAYALGHSGANVASDQVTIVAGGTANYIETSTVDATSVWTAGSGYTFQNGNYYVSQNNNNLAIRTTSQNWTWENNRMYYTTGNWWNPTNRYIRYNNGFSISTTQSNVYLFEETTTGGEVTGGDYRGFYAWRVKSLGGGLTITGKNVGDIIYPDETIEFVTSNAEGNEVEFEALWAKAWVNDASNRASNSGNYKNAYERNFKTTISNYGYPVTITTLTPDGQGTVGSLSTGTFSCDADYKFENMTLSATTLNANNHSLHIGRGVSNGSSNVAGTVNGNGTSAFTLRVESGQYTNIYGFNGTTSSNAFTANIILGSDYDRANNSTNTNLTVTGAVQAGVSSAYLSSANTNVNVTVLSGTFGSTGDDTELYMGFQGVNRTCLAKRNLEVFGGNFKGGIAGGIESGVATATKVLKMRIHGGIVHQYVYGAGQFTESSGSRSTIITGGTFDCWIAGGCYGTYSNTAERTGSTDGNTYVYVGGKANQTSDGGIYGAGYGNYSTATGYYTVKKSFIVVADDATIAGNVYGGGNNGYCTDDSEVWVLGGGGEKLTVTGNVYGGANKARSGAKTTVTMKGGTVSGSLYGGANTSGEVAGLATVNVSGGKVGNVFGGGLGSSTNMAAGTAVNISGGTINNNVYGGGDAGTVSGNTNVKVSGGTMKDVYGAGKGGSTTALVSGQTNVTVTGGTISGDVFGGGQNGNVAFTGSSTPSTGETTTYDFASGFDGWTTIDADGDGYNWKYSNEAGVTGYGGTYGCVYSESYDNDTYTALTPDNYLVSPQITLGGSISFWACAQDASYPAEHFGVAVSSDGTNFTTIQDWTMTATKGNSVSTHVTRSGNRDQGTWKQYTVDLSAYTGQGYVAIRHFNCTDQFYLVVDDITITEPANGEVPEVVPASIVSINGGEVTGSVFGGGKMGKTTGATTVNVGGGNIRKNVFGGAEGEQQKVFVTGLRTVNMTGGHVYGHVYGGSRNANDGNSLDLQDSQFASSTEKGTICVTNISGGIIDQNVYAAGYYGNTFGSVYVFVGKNAIENAPNRRPSPSLVTYSVKALQIMGDIWAGGDWGTFQGSYGSSTISGNSNIYVDGLDYETETTQTSNAQYMNIGGSILGGGTSCHAGKEERTIIVRNYGHADDNQPTEATRTLFSIQLAKVLIFDNSNINFTGQGQIDVLNTTEKYAIYKVANGAVTDADPYGVRLVNGSGLFLNAPISQIANFKSMSCSDVYSATVDDDSYVEVLPSTLSATPNKIRVNGGNYIEVKYGSKFGALIGYAYMMPGTGNDDGTCAYARPRWESNASFQINDENYDNRNDGGWVSYTASENTFALDGTAGNVQMPYENHTVAKNGEDYFRIWRIGGDEHFREGVFNAAADGTDSYSTVDVVISLPPYRDPNNYYRFERTEDHENYTINYGADVLTFNAANSAKPCAEGNWISCSGTTQTTGQNQSDVSAGLNKIKQNPDVNFGLVGMPSTGMGGSNYIICSESEDLLIADESTFPKTDNTKEPEFIFRLTYYNKLSSNMTWDPMTIVLVQCDANGKEVDRVTISLVVNTSASIEQEFNTTLYAIMQGKGSTSDTYDAKVVLPTFSVWQGGEESTFTLNSVNFTSENNGKLVERGDPYTYTDYAVTYAAGYNYDNTCGWETGTTGHFDAYPSTGLDGESPTAQDLGECGGRNAFAIDFKLHYNGNLNALKATDTIGTLKFNITFDNYKKQTGTDPDTGEPIYTQVDNQPLTIVVTVIRRGEGTKFYLDGVNGSNANTAKYPDDAVISLSTIFNRCGYLAGDEIYIVNQITTNKSLHWNGLPYSNVKIYRYDGGHELTNADAYIIGNEDNKAYTGILLDVKSKMEMTGITLDGHYNGGSNQIVVGYNEQNEPVYGPFTPVTSAAPMIQVENGGTLELGQGTVLQENNNNTGNGGAVNLVSGGTLMMNQDAQITKNVVSNSKNGGGVYMDGTMIVSDDIKVVGNKKGTTTENNVFLTSKDQVVQIGTDISTDDYAELGEDAEIGVTKELDAAYNGYTRVVYVESQTAWLETPFNSEPNAIIFHDGHKYQLVKYTPNNFLYWIGTWVTVQDHEPTEAEDDGGVAWDGIGNITTANQLAWVISLVNGENNQTADDMEGDTIVINADINMNQSIWVPIGTTTHPFKGTFQGNGHVISGVRSPLDQTNLAMFGIANGATIQDVIANVKFEGNATNMAAVAAQLNGASTLSNIEAAGIITGGNYTEVMGGVAANVAADATIHSCFSVATLTVGNTTAENVGGLIGVNAGDLFNSYSNCAISGGANKGGLVGTNDGRVENCYTVLGERVFPAFAVVNNGTINYCYADKETTYVGTENGTTAKSGYFGAVQTDIKALDYMYGDNIVTATGNNYVKTTHEYVDNHTVVWNGLLSVLNQWVADGQIQGKPDGLTKWNRPINNAINGDLPVLAFPMDNSLATANSDGKYLQYSTGLDNLLTDYSGQASGIFVYGAVTDVAKVPTENVKVTIAEDAVLLQAENAGDFNATVGVTFDNSDHGQNAYDYYGNNLKYDWHFMSTPLADASTGATYTNGTFNNSSAPNISGMVNGYFPNGLGLTTPAPEGSVMWDFYTYYEPHYHWINLKRGPGNHWHTDGGAIIPYVEDDNTATNAIFVPGKGYMMAISQDSYMSNTGKLNNGDVTIKLTNKEPGDLHYNKGWNLVGNPYQAYLDLDEVGEGAFYIYDAESGDYVPYTKGSSKNPVTPSRYIHPHQGFFMYSASDNTFTFTQGMATTQEDDSYFRKDDRQLNYPLVNLFARNQAGNNDLTIIEFNRPEIGGATKVGFMTNANFQIAAHLDGENYGLLFTPEGVDRIPVHFKTSQDGTFKLTWSTYNGTFTSLYLVDNMTGVHYDMLANDSYTFQATTEDYESRFYISGKYTGVEENDGETVISNFAFFDGSQWVVNGKGRLELVDVTGRVLHAERLYGDQNTVSLGGFSSGLYLLRLTDGKNVMVQKIVIK